MVPENRPRWLKGRVRELRLCPKTLANLFDTPQWIGDRKGFWKVGQIRNMYVRDHANTLFRICRVEVLEVHGEMGNKKVLVRRFYE